MTSRVQIGPAGSAKLLMARVILVRMMGSPVMRFFENKNTALKVLKDYNTVMNAPILYHVNAYVSNIADTEYLTPRDNSVSVADIPIIGLLGIFAKTFYKGSTLLASPIFSTEGSIGDRISSLEGYSTKWDGICKGVQNAINETKVKLQIVECVELAAAELNLSWMNSMLRSIIRDKQSHV